MIGLEFSGTSYALREIVPKIQIARIPLIRGRTRGALICKKAQDCFIASWSAGPIPNVRVAQRETQCDVGEVDAWLPLETLTVGRREV